MRASQPEQRQATNSRYAPPGHIFSLHFLPLEQCSTSSSSSAASCVCPSSFLPILLWSGHFTRCFSANPSHFTRVYVTRRRQEPVGRQSHVGLLTTHTDRPHPCMGRRPCTFSSTSPNPLFSEGYKTLHDCHKSMNRTQILLCTNVKQANDRFSPLQFGPLSLLLSADPCQS